MKRLIPTLVALLAIGFVVSELATSQIVDYTDSSPTPVVVVEPPVVSDVGADETGSIIADSTMAEVHKHIDNQNRTNWWKRRMHSKVERPAIRNQICDMAVVEALNTGVVPPPTMWATDGSDQVVAPAINIDALIEMIMKLMPFIMQLIGLFGGFMVVGNLSRSEGFKL